MIAPAVFLGEEAMEATLRKPQRTFEAILEVLRDGAWHSLEDVSAATRYPGDWVTELRAEGVVEVEEGLVTLVRLDPGFAT